MRQHTTSGTLVPIATASWLMAPCQRFPLQNRYLCTAVSSITVCYIRKSPNSKDGKDPGGGVGGSRKFKEGEGQQRSEGGGGGVYIYEGAHSFSEK